MTAHSPRFIYLIGFILIAILLSATLYLQLYDGFNPCPLCILQRLTLIILGILFFFGALIAFKKIGQIIIGLLAFLTTLCGLLLSGRQVWLQHLPPNEGGGCGVSLQYLLHALPLDQVAKKIFEGSADCAQTGWEFMQLSLAHWSLIGFIIFASLALLQLSRALAGKF